MQGSSSLIPGLSKNCMDGMAMVWELGLPTIQFLIAYVQH